MKCIFCNREYEKLSEEHIFPEAIGGSLILHNKVCKPCNDKLGEQIDSLLTNHYIITLARNVLSIDGKTGIPNPFKAGILEDGRKVKVMMDSEKKFFPKLTPEVKKTKPNKYHISVDETEREHLPTIIRKIAQRNAYNITDQEILDIIEEGEEHSVLSPISCNFEIDTKNYKKAILKIAYEMGFYWLGDEYQHDPIAEQIRTSIFGKFEEIDIVGTAGLISDESCPLFSAPNFENKHIAILVSADKRLGCMIRVFDVFCAYIIISENAQLYKDIGDGFFVSIDPVSGQIEEMPLVKAIAEYFPDPEPNV